jgi:Ca-activated chloride channel family protein
VLITDGEDHEGGVNQAIRQLKDSEIELVVLGLGTTAGGLVPNDPKSGVSGYVKDASGRPAKSKLNPEMLQEIAAQANGAIVISSDAFPNLSPLLTQINNLKTTKQVDLEFEIKENRYRIPLAIGLFFLLLLLVVDIVMLFRKSAE